MEIYMPIYFQKFKLEELKKYALQKLPYGHTGQNQNFFSENIISHWEKYLKNVQYNSNIR